MRADLDAPGTQEARKELEEVVEDVTGEGPDWRIDRYELGFTYFEEELGHWVVYDGKYWYGDHVHALEGFTVKEKQ
ncbi:hypothetical protein [Microbacterium sp. A93]|uniref:hypothetical protein n=1 Tax=Microbacterium sp. A93 TaxID=3450716 RepID=UPI003F4257D2